MTIEELKRAACEIKKICDNCHTCKECPFNGEGAGCRFKAPFPRKWMVGIWKEKVE